MVLPGRDGARHSGIDCRFMMENVQAGTGAPPPEAGNDSRLITVRYFQGSAEMSSRNSIRGLSRNFNVDSVMAPGASSRRLVEINV